MDGSVLECHGSIRFIPHPKSRNVEMSSPQRLTLACFSKPPRISFDNVELGNSSTKQLSIYNPNDCPVKLFSIQIPQDKGLQVCFAESKIGHVDSFKNVSFDSYEEQKLLISWKPTSVGKMRANITFQWEGGPRLSCIVFGNCPDAKTRIRKERDKVRKPLHSNINKENIPSKTTKINKAEKTVKKIDTTNKKILPVHKELQESGNSCETSENASTPRRSTFAVKKESTTPTTDKSEQWNSNCVQIIDSERQRDPFDASSLTLQPRHSSPENESMRTFLQNMENMSAVKADQDLISFDVTVLASNRPASCNDTQGNSCSKHNLKDGTYVKDDFTPEAMAMKADKTYAVPLISETVRSPELSFATCDNKVDEAGLTLPDGGQCASDTFSEHSSYKLPITFSPLVERTFEASNDNSKLLNRSFEITGKSQIDNSALVVSPSATSYLVEDIKQPLLQLASPASSIPIPSSSCMVTPYSSHTKTRKNSSSTSLCNSTVEDGINQRTKRSGSILGLSADRQSENTKGIRSGSRSLRGRSYQNKPKARPPLKRNLAQNTLPIKKLKLLRPPKSSLAKHPLPYATKNTFYDEKWMQKQEKAFTNWLNFVLTPSEEYDLPSEDIGITDTVRNQPIAPSREDLSYRVYSAKRKMSRLRYAACSLYQSDKLSVIICRVESEVERGRIAIRDDRHLEADVGIKRKIHDLLMMFNSLWLRIGLEVVYGEIIPMQSNGDMSMLSRFVMQRFLSNPDISREYAHPTVPGLHKKGYETAIHKFILKKLLLLVLFLDHAKQRRLIDHDPCLFKQDAEFKCCKDLLLAFSRDYLKGEGDITRHLLFLGYNTTHIQTALDEFDFGVKNLAADLRSGIRLVRVIELITQKWILSKKLRVPATSRLQKIHNVEVAFDLLKNLGLELTYRNGQKLDPRQIVDGHREKTLALLWEMILYFKIRPFLEPDKLRKEINFIQKVQGLKQIQFFINQSGYGLENHGMKGALSFLEQFTADNKLPEGVGLLLKWCYAVCHLYDTKVENLSSSFSDGRAFCYLVHHYHPEILPREKIIDDTTLTCCLSEDKDHLDDELIYDNWSECCSPNSGKNRKLEELLSHEKQNFKALSEAVKQLGGVPSLVSAAHMSNTIPDEKVVITYLSYLSIRLIDIQEETHAARTIQLCWRYYCKRKQSEEQLVQIRAARTIQKFVRKRLQANLLVKQNNAAICIQSVWRAYRTRKMLIRKEEAARKIQSCYKSWKLTEKLRDEFLHLRKVVCWMQGNYRQRKERQRRAATIIQSCFRCYLTRRRHQVLVKTVIQMQRLYRSSKKASREKRAYLTRRGAAVKIQSIVRMHSCHKEFILIKRNTILVQSLVRMKLVQQKYRHMLAASCSIQIWFRSLLRVRKIRREFLSKRQAAIVIQRSWRRYLEEAAAKKRAVVAATKIQACARMFLVRISLQKKTSAAILIQTRYRAYHKGRMCYLRYHFKRGAIITIQANYRGYLVRKRMVRCHQAATRIQTVFLRFQLRSRFLKVRKYAVMVQRIFRAKKDLERKRCLDTQRRCSAIKIQALFRGHLTRRRLASLATIVTAVQRAYRVRKSAFEAERRKQVLTRSCLIIQSSVRCYLQRRSYLTLKNATVALQRRYRGNISASYHRERYLKMKVGFTRLQAVVRGWLVYRKYRKLQEAASNVQRHWRAIRMGRKCRHDFLLLKTSVVKIQSLVRMATQRRRYLLQRKAACIIQGAYRAYSACQKERELVQAVITIQSSVRGYRARMLACRRRLASQKIRAFVHSYIVRQRFLKVKSSVTLLQRKWRATQAMLNQREKYVAMRRATVYCQSMVRMSIQRREYLELKYHVVMLQSCVRRRICMEQYHRKRKAALCIQTFTRHCLAEKQKRRREMAAVKLQSVYRGHMCRLVYQRRLKAVRKIQHFIRHQLELRSVRHAREAAAATKLQSIFRGMMCRKRYNQYLKLNRCVTAVQSRWRANRAMHIQRRRYTALRDATIYCQSIVRMSIQRRRYLELRHHAVVVQSLVRRKICMTEYHQRRNAVMCIQTFVRHCLDAKRQRRRAMAAIKLQSIYRGYLCRVAYQRQLKAVLTIQYFGRHQLQVRKERRAQEAAAATKLQSIFRGMMCRKRYSQYLEQKRAVVVLQRRWRANRAMHSQRQRYAALKNATVCCQSVARMAIERRRYLELRRHVIMLQSHVRRRICMRQYHRRWEAVICLQTFFRHCLEEKLQRKREEAAIKIQSVFRGYLCRIAYQRQLTGARKIQLFVRQWLVYKRELHAREAAATKLQSLFRGMICRKRYRRYLDLQHCAIAVQRRWRANCAMATQRKQYTAMKSSAIFCQSMVRMSIQRKSYLQLRHFTVVLQSFVRRKICMRRFYQKRNAVICIQKFMRHCLEEKRQQRREMAAIKLQSIYRCYLCRVAYQRRIEAIKRIQFFFRQQLVLRSEHHAREMAATQLQSVFRGMMCRKQYQQQLELKHAAVRVQRRWKATRAMRIQCHKYAVLRRATICCQSMVRMSIHRRRYLELRRHTIMLQSLVRRKICMGDYHRRRKAVNCIQAFVRRYLEERQQRREELAATKLQSVYRGYVCKVAYQRQLKAARKIQCFFRCQSEVRRERRARELAAVKLQSVFRGMVCSKHYRQQQEAVIVLQRAFKLHLNARNHKVNNATVVVQSVFRMVVARNRYNRMRDAALTVQKTWRSKCAMHRERQAFLITRSAAIVIQSFVRKCLQQRAFIMSMILIVKIQSNVRRFLAVKQFQRQKSAAIKIQSQFRGYMERRSFICKKHSCCLIQACFKGFLERRRFSELRQCVIFVQRHYRNGLYARRIRQEFITLRWTTIKLQRFYRQAVVIRKTRQLSAIVILQSAARMWLVRKKYLFYRNQLSSAIKIQAFYRGYLARKVFKQHPYFVRKMAAMKIQSFWRGYQVRKRMNKRMSNIRKRIEAAGDRADESMKLCNRTKSALDYLLNCKKLSTVFDALTFLEFGSRMSFKCCEQIVMDGAVDVLYGIIQNCNRSLASIEIIQMVLRVLTNLSKCPSTYKALYLGNETGQLLLELLSKFHDKNKGSIFRQTCFLLTILAHDKIIGQKILEIPSILVKLNGIKKVIDRKQSMASARLNTKERIFEKSFMRRRRRGDEVRTMLDATQLWYKHHSRRDSESTPLLAISSLLRCLEAKRI